MMTVVVVRVVAGKALVDQHRPLQPSTKLQCRIQCRVLVIAHRVMHPVKDELAFPGFVVVAEPPGAFRQMGC